MARFYSHIDPLSSPHQILKMNIEINLKKSCQSWTTSDKTFWVRAWFVKELVQGWVDFTTQTCYLDPLIKNVAKLNPLWQYFLDPRMNRHMHIVSNQIETFSAQGAKPYLPCQCLFY